MPGDVSWVFKKEQRRTEPNFLKLSGSLGEVESIEKWFESLHWSMMMPTEGNTVLSKWGVPIVQEARSFQKAEEPATGMRHITMTSWVDLSDRICLLGVGCGHKSQVRRKKGQISLLKVIFHGRRLCKLISLAPKICINIGW